MAGFTRGRWWLTLGVLAGMPSLFWFGFGRMQNVYGALFLTVGMVCLRRTNRWARAGLLLSAALLVGLLVAFNEFLQGTFGLWVFGGLTTLAYGALVRAVQVYLRATGWQGAARIMGYGLVFVLAAHLLYMALGGWLPVRWFGLLPLAAQLAMLVLLWMYGGWRSHP